MQSTVPARAPRAGKARAKRNSWRHGLSVNPYSILPHSPEIKQLADVICGEDADSVRLHFATIAAEAELEMLRVRGIRQSLLESKIGGDPTILDSERAVGVLAGVLSDLNRLERYEHRSFAAKSRITAALTSIACRFPL
jgi:hypothetical protein